jgi:hypothetical protein
MRLRNITNGWTLDLRKHYLGWFLKKRDHLAHRPEIVQSFHDVGLAYHDGISVEPYLENFLNEAIATLSESEREALGRFSAQGGSCRSHAHDRAQVRQGLEDAGFAAGFGQGEIPSVL